MWCLDGWTCPRRCPLATPNFVSAILLPTFLSLRGSNLIQTRHRLLDPAPSCDLHQRVNARHSRRRRSLCISVFVIHPPHPTPPRLKTLIVYKHQRHLQDSAPTPSLTPYSDTRLHCRLRALAIAVCVFTSPLDFTPASTARFSTKVSTGCCIRLSPTPSCCNPTRTSIPPAVLSPSPVLSAPDAGHQDFHEISNFVFRMRFHVRAYLPTPASHPASLPAPSPAVHELFTSQVGRGRRSRILAETQSGRIRCVLVPFDAE